VDDVPGKMQMMLDEWHPKMIGLVLVVNMMSLEE
jgi:hypothetical protein